MMPDPNERPTMGVKEAGRILEISEATAYEAARRYLATDGREGLPVIRLGARRLIVPTALLQELLGLGTDRDALKEVAPISDE